MPDIHPSAWVAPSAQIFGAVTIAERASVWHNAVLRAECQEIRIGRLTNVQDFVMIHVPYDRATVVGAFCSITHHVTLHGCTIEDECLIGINATVMDGVVIGRGSIVAGIPAKVVRERVSARENRLNAWLYHRNAEHYRRGDHRAWDGPEYEAWLAAKRDEIARDADL